MRTTYRLVIAVTIQHSADARPEAGEIGMLIEENLREIELSANNGWFAEIRTEDVEETSTSK